MSSMSTLRSSEQSKKCRSHSTNMQKVLYSQNSKILLLSNMADTFFEYFTRCPKFYFLDCAFRVQLNSDHMILIMFL